MRVHGVRIIGARGDRIITRNNILTYTAVLSLSFPLSLSHASAHTLHLFFSLFLSRCVDYKCLDFARDGIKLNFSNDTERSVRAPLLFFSLPLTRPLLSSKPARRNANISAVFPYTYAGNLAHALRSFFSLSFSLFLLLFRASNEAERKRALRWCEIFIYVYIQLGCGVCCRGRRRVSTHCASLRRWFLVVSFAPLFAANIDFFSLPCGADERWWWV